jgi:putative transposase
MPRTARSAPGGVVFHVLNRGNARSPVFEDAGDYAAFVKVLAQTLALFPTVRLLAYCLMPSHWHLVLWPTRDGELGRFMQRLTVTHVRRWHEHRRSTGVGHLYQGTYKSFPAQRDEHLLTLIRYVERNALRSNLSRRAQDWRWCSLWAAESDDPAAAEARSMLHDWPFERPANWTTLVNRPQSAAEEEALLTSIQRGRPFGSDAWQKRTATRLGLGHTFRERGRPPKKPRAAIRAAGPARRKRA